MIILICSKKSYLIYLMNDHCCFINPLEAIASQNQTIWVKKSHVYRDNRDINLYFYFVYASSGNQTMESHSSSDASRSSVYHVRDVFYVKCVM